MKPTKISNQQQGRLTKKKRHMSLNSTRFICTEASAGCVGPFPAENEEKRRKHDERKISADKIGLSIFPPKPSSSSSFLLLRLHPTPPVIP
jgi:hypothetical protein